MSGNIQSAVYLKMGFCSPWMCVLSLTVCKSTGSQVYYRLSATCYFWSSQQKRIYSLSLAKGKLRATRLDLQVRKEPIWFSPWSKTCRRLSQIWSTWRPVRVLVYSKLNYLKLLFPLIRSNDLLPFVWRPVPAEDSAYGTHCLFG